MTAEPEIAHLSAPFPLECGRELAELAIAYETHGQLSAERNNAILVCHGLTADSHVASRTGVDGDKPGWWERAVGPGLMIDTNRYFVICANVPGGWGGSTGPASLDPATGAPYAMRFPMVTIRDMVDAQRRLLDHLGIPRLHAAIGGCLGGMQALEWARRYPNDLERAIVIGATHRTSTHTLALWHTLRRAIMADPRWNGGDYYGSEPPLSGVGLATTIGMLIWMSREELTRRFDRRTVGEDYAFTFGAEFQVEQFLDQVGRSATARVDANSLLYLMRAMDYFDLSRGHASLAEALSPAMAEFLLVSYRSDWRYPPEEMEEIRTALAAGGSRVRHAVLDSAIGHGAFLYDIEKLAVEVSAFLADAS